MEETSEQIEWQVDLTSIEDSMTDILDSLDGVSQSLDTLQTGIAGIISVETYIFVGILLAFGALLFLAFALTMRRF